MSHLHWQGSDSEFHLRGGPQPGLLRVDETGPGLTWPEGNPRAKLLVLHSLASVDRCDEGAFAAGSLVGVAQHRDRVEATFVPSGWHGLRVRAAWSIAPVGEGIDLEVQIQAATADVLELVEVGILSEWGEQPSAPTVIKVEPRDARSAALSYDGRESAHTLRSLITLPIPPSSPQVLAPRIFTISESGTDAAYIEMVQPDDCARRIRREPAMSEMGVPAWMSTRYALFGHDLEKGVVVRARLRGLWTHSTTAEQEARVCSEAFLSEPPPLGP